MKVIDTRAVRQHQDYEKELGVYYKTAREDALASVKAHFDKAHKDAVAQHAKSAPKPVTLKRHPEGEEPLELAGNVVVMGGDYYHEAKDGAFVVAAASVGEGKDWEPVE